MLGLSSASACKNLTSSASQTQFIDWLTERLDLVWELTGKCEVSRAPNVPRWPIVAVQVLKSRSSR